MPGRYVTRLDFSDLNHIHSGLAEQFLLSLLTKACFEFKISFDGIDFNSIQPEEQKKLGLLSKRLNSINIENDDNYKEHGIKTFGFGFPILIKPSKQDPKKIIKAPILIWQLDIIKATNKVNTWSILRNKIRNENGQIKDEEVHSVGLNEVLLSFLKTDESILIPQINEELLEDAIIDKTELIDECYKVLKSLNTNTSTSFKESLLSKFNEPLNQIPEANTLESFSGNIPWIHFGGVFGLFRTQKESIITDIDKLIEKFDDFEFENLIVEKLSGTAHSAVETDPSQQEILTTLGIEPKKIIQGPPGTGKSQTLTALITNALANNLKCLVVCEKKTALDIIKNNLHRENEQLGALAAVIEDISKDRDGIVNSVRDRLGNLSQNPSFNQLNYTTVRDIVESKVVELNHQYKQLYKNIYLGKAWTELVGEFFKRQKEIYNFSFLNEEIKPTEFKFNKDETELASILASIREAIPLFAEIKKLHHPLLSLYDSHFLEDNPRVKQIELSQQITIYLKELNLYKENVEKEYNNYIKKLEEHYSNHFENVQTLTVNLINEFERNKKQFKKDFTHESQIIKTKINILSIVSTKYKRLKEKKNDLLIQYDYLKETVYEWSYIQHNFLDNTLLLKDKNLIHKNLIELLKTNQLWKEELTSKRDKYFNNFSVKNLHKIYRDRNFEIEKLENYGDGLVEKINSAKIIVFNVFMEENLLNEIRCSLSDIEKELRNIQENLTDFIPYYYWKRFVLKTPPLHIKIIESLIKANTKNWVTTFECWYLFWLLAIAESDLNRLPKNDDKIIEFTQAKSDFKKKQIQQIISNWRGRQKSSRERFEKDNNIGINILYNLARNSAFRGKNRLRTIIQSDFQLFTDCFPVIMVSPTVCSSVLPLTEGLFDIVIFDEASQLRLEDTFPALVRGKIKIVSGDSQQMPPSNFFQGGAALLNPTEEEYEEEQSVSEIQISNRNTNNSLDLADSESLLVYAENSNYKQSYLRVHYRSHHPYLIDFSNHAFYGKRLIPMPAKQEYKPIQFIEVNGLYEDQLNKDEARQVVDILLNHIKPFKNGKYPSVGVATFNLYQRNLILEEITKARQQNPEHDKKIADLGSDLFVKNLENIQGDERDIIIISTTFGRKSDGTFRQTFGPIVQGKGYKLLNVIITRAKYKVYVCTSIPLEKINEFSNLLQQSKNTGRGVFYAYLAYAKSVSDGNLDARENILSLLYENCESKSYDVEEVYGSESPFEDEVFYRLAEKIGQERLQQQYKIGGFRIDLIIKSKVTSKPVIAIECDGAKYHSSNEAYAWDMFRQSRLEEQGFVFYRIWSTNWWNSSEKELKKLVDFIYQFDKEEKLEKLTQVDEALKENEIIPMTLRPETKKKIGISSIVTVKNPEGKILKVRFCKSQSTQNIKPDNNGLITIYENSPLGMAVMGRTVGETCQLGMLELYYEILNVE